jgi:tetratricopeptide (TPR) repeat protein
VFSYLLLASISMAGGLSQLRKELKGASDANDSAAEIELARRILKADPRDGEAWTALVQGLIDTNDDDRALAAVGAWEAELGHPTAETEGFRGDACLDQKHPVAAERAWRASLAMKGDAADMLGKLADLLETEDRWTESVVPRERAIAAEPGDASHYANYAAALLHLHRWDEAIAAINHGNQLDATETTVQHWLPLIEQLEQWLPSIKELDGEIAAKPKEPERLLDQAILFEEANEPALALANARRALALDAGSALGHVLATAAELDLGDPDAAAKFKISHDMKLQRGADGHMDVTVFMQLAAADAAVRENPGKAAPYAARSKALRQLNQYVLALQEARIALRLDRALPQAEFEVGHDLDGLGRPGEALPHIVRATELRPNDPVAWYYRGVIEANRADYRAAIASQTRSLGIRESAVALQARADCELRLGLAAQAAADTQRLSQLPPTPPE